MKVIIWILIVCSLIVLTSAITSNIYAPLHIITLKDITPDERRQIAYLEQKLERAKRSGGSSGSGEILNLLKNAVGNGIKKKIGQLASASAAASGTFSKTSSSGGYGKEYYYHTDHHAPEEHHYSSPHSSIDFWDLKKSVLNTLLQAVKAIKGGVLAIKGQLIKGGGKLVSASGVLVSSAGDAITQKGKTIATNAILVPYHASKGTPHHTHAEYGDSANHYSGPSGHEDVYHSGPSAPSLDYHVPENYPPPHREGAAGLLILKKVSGSNQGSYQQGSSHQNAYHQDFHQQGSYPQGSSQYSRQSISPSIGTMFAKFFTASSSLDPNQPELFGNEAQPSSNAERYQARPSNNVESYQTRPPNNIDSYQAYILQGQTNQKEIAPTSSGVVSQEVHSTKTPENPEGLVQNDNPLSSFVSSFEESPGYLNENFDNLVANQINKNPEIPQNSLTVTNNFPFSEDGLNQAKPFSNHFEYDPQTQFPVNFPDYTSADLAGSEANSFPKTADNLPNTFSSTKSTQPEQPKITISRFLETPKLKLSLPSSNEIVSSDYQRLPGLSEFKFSQKPNTESYLKYKKPYGSDVDLVKSISFEIGPNGARRVT